MCSLLVTSTLTPEGLFLLASLSLSLSLAVTFAGAPGYPHAIGQPLQSYLLGTKSPVQHQVVEKKRSLAICKRSVSSLLGLRLQLSKMQQWASSAIIEGRVYQLKIAPGSLHISSWEKGNLFISVGLIANQWSLQMSTERKSMRHLAKALTKNSSCFVVSLQKRALKLLSNQLFQLFLTPCLLQLTIVLASDFELMIQIIALLGNTSKLSLHRFGCAHIESVSWELHLWTSPSPFQQRVQRTPLIPHTRCFHGKHKVSLTSKLRKGKTPSSRMTSSRSLEVRAEMDKWSHCHLHKEIWTWHDDMMTWKGKTITCDARPRVHRLLAARHGWHELWHPRSSLLSTQRVFTTWVPGQLKATHTSQKKKQHECVEGDWVHQYHVNIHQLNLQIPHVMCAESQRPIALAESCLKSGFHWRLVKPGCSAKRFGKKGFLSAMRDLLGILHIFVRWHGDTVTPLTFPLFPIQIIKSSNRVTG